MGTNAYQLLVKGKLDDTQIRKKLKALSGKQTFDVKISGGKEIQNLTKQTTKYKDSLGNIVTVTKSLDKETGKMVTSMSTATRESRNFISTFTTITKKVAAFGLATSAIGLFTSAITEAKDAVFEFDKALTEMKKVSSYSNEELEDYTKRLGEIGQEVARTRWVFPSECV